MSVPAIASYSSILHSLGVLQNLSTDQLEEYAEELREIDDTLTFIIDQIEEQSQKGDDLFEEDPDDAYDRWKESKWEPI